MARSSSALLSVCRPGSRGGEADCTVVWVRGQQDVATRASLVVSLVRAAQLDDVPIVVDLSAVTFMDASTVDAIVATRNCLRVRGQSLELRDPSAAALRILELCALVDLIIGLSADSAGRATALGSWVEVPSIEPREPKRRREPHERSTPRVANSHPSYDADRILVAPDGTKTSAQPKRPSGR